jgi:hypothetical protein
MAGRAGRTRPDLAQTRERALLFAILLCGVGVRLVRIGEPFVDAWSWRQSDVAMIAENFFRHGYRLLYPQVNWAGHAPGYVGTEFQLVPFLAALAYPAAGMREAVGRAVSVAFFAASVPAYYALVKKVFGAPSAFFALGLYTLAPLAVFAGRAFMPDMASLSGSIAALWLFASWLEDGRCGTLCAAAGCAAVAVLTKLPAAVIAIPCLYMAWRRFGPVLVRRPGLWAAAAAVAAVSAAWYVHAYRLGVSNYPHDVWILGSGFSLLPLEDYGGIAAGALFSGVTAPVSALMLAGLWGGLRQPAGPYPLLFHWWLAGIALFLFLASDRSLQHWYALPVVPPAAALAGSALPAVCRRLRRAGRAALVAGVAAFFAGVAALSYFYASAWYTPRAEPLLRAGMAVRRSTPPDALVIFVDDGDPAGLYYSERRGWHFLSRGRWAGYPSESSQAIADLEALRAEGASYLVFPRSSFWWFRYYPQFGRYLDARYARLRQTPQYLIFDLRRSRAPRTLQSRRRRTFRSSASRSAGGENDDHPSAAAEKIFSTVGPPLTLVSGAASV